MNWYIYLTIAAVAMILYWICDRFNFIKSKPLRIFLTIFAASILCWIIYDLLIAM